MTTAQMPTPENIPRDLDTIAKQSRAVRYRLALALNICQSGTESERGWVSFDPNEQARQILMKLQERDAAGGAQPAMAAPAAVAPVGQPIQPQPMQMPGGAPPAAAPPPVSPPPAAAPPSMGAPPGFQGQVPHQPAPAPTLPAQPPLPPGTPPGMAPPPGMPQQPAPGTQMQIPHTHQQAAPPAMQPPAMQQPPPGMQAAPARQPSTAADPTNAGAGGPGAHVQKTLADIHAALVAVKTELDSCAGQADLMEVRADVQGLSRVVGLSTLLLLDIAEQTLGLEKHQILSMANAALDAGELSNLLGQVGQGKG